MESCARNAILYWTTIPASNFPYSKKKALFFRVSFFPLQYEAFKLILFSEVFKNRRMVFIVRFFFIKLNTPPFFRVESQYKKEWENIGYEKDVISLDSHELDVLSSDTFCLVITCSALKYILLYRTVSGVRKSQHRIKLL